MIAPYEKAKLAGYDVEPDGDGGWSATTPDGETITPADAPEGVEAFSNERAAWEACDRHRMFGHAAERHMRAVAATLETRRVVVLRTENLSLATCTLLDATPLESWPVAGGKLPHGFYIYAHDEGGADDAPADLQAVCTWANKAGFDYIQFDHDCDTFAPGLPVYDHAPRPPVDALEAFAKVRALFATWEGWSAHADGYDPAELLAAIAEAVGAELNGKPAAPVTDTLAEKMERYNDALGDLGISPNGDDFNALLDFAVGQPYREPHEKGR